MGAVHELANLLIDEALRGLRALADARQERPLFTGREHGDGAHGLAHTPAPDHLAGNLCERADVGLGARADRPVDDLLRHAAAERDADPRFELLAHVGDAVLVWRRERHPQGHPARDDRDFANRIRAGGEHPDERVARLVIGRALAIGWREHDPAR